MKIVHVTSVCNATQRVCVTTVFTSHPMTTRFLTQTWPRPGTHFETTFLHLKNTPSTPTLWPPHFWLKLDHHIFDSNLTTHRDPLWARFCIFVFEQFRRKKNTPHPRFPYPRPIFIMRTYFHYAYTWPTGSDLIIKNPRVNSLAGIKKWHLFNNNRHLLIK